MAGKDAGQHVIPKDGMPGLVRALESAAVQAGVTIRTDCSVKTVQIEGDESGQHCTGVELESGETLLSDRVVSSADPQTTFLKLIGAQHLEIEFTNRISRLRNRGYVARVNLALSALPTFQGLDSPHGRLIIAPTMDSIEFAWDAAKYEELPASPVMEVLVPSLQAPGLAPEGQHVLVANVMYVPYDLKSGWTPGSRDELLNTVLRELERYAPGIQELVLASELLTPQDLASQYRVTNGHWHHCEPAIDQLLMMRPTYEAAQYATPIPGLYLCGAGCHPAGDVSGNPGRNAAKEILA
jgi:phytoene dehydrogenase-like protein